MQPNPPSPPQTPPTDPTTNHLFKRQLKIDDYLQVSPENSLCITESSHPMFGSGSKVWQSSVFLAKALAYLNEERVYPMANKTVLELGCGAGLLSIYLGALGAEVYATDLPIVRDLVERNIRDNKIVVHERVRFLPYNWNDKWESELKFDYIVASEPFVSKQATSAFFKVFWVLNQTLRFILEKSKPNCKAFVTFKLKDNDLYKFAQSLEDNGLHQTKWSVDDMHPDYADPRTVIYTIGLL